MQESERHPVTFRVSDPRQLPTLPSIQAPTAPIGCITKKWLFYTLRPDRVVYRAAVVREFMAAADRLERCGIGADEFNRIKIFSAEATAVILNDLRQLNFVS